MFDELPRDVQLQVIKKFDMDTRIKCGIIGRLHIPNTVKRHISAKLRHPTSVSYNNIVYRWYIDLGCTYSIYGVQSPMYTIDVSINENGDNMRWSIKHTSRDLYAPDYYDTKLNDKTRYYKQPRPTNFPSYAFNHITVI